MKPSEVKWMLKNVAHSDSVRFFSDDDIYAYLNPLPNSALVTAEDLLEKPPVATHFMKVGPPVKFFADWLNGQSWQLEASTLLEEAEVPLGNITKIIKLSHHNLYLFDQNYKNLTRYDLRTGKFGGSFSISDQQYHQYYQISVEMDSALRKKLLAIDQGSGLPKTRLVDIAPFGNQLIVSAILDFPMLDPKKAGNVMSQRNTRLFLLDSNFRQIKDWQFINQGFIDKNIFPTGNGIAFDGQLFTCNFRFPISNAFEEIKENKAFIAFQLAVDTLRPKETVGTIPGFLHDKSYYATNLETAIYQGVPYGGFRFALYYWHGVDQQTYRLEIGLGEADFYHPADSSFHYRLLSFSVPNRDEVKILYRYKTAIYVLHQGANYEVIRHEKLPFVLPNDKLPIAAF